MIYGVFEGLSLGHAQGYQRVELHIDYIVVVNTLKSRCCGSVVGWRLVQHIICLLEMN